MWQKCSAWTLAFSGSPEFLYADMLFIPFASGSEQGKGVVNIYSPDDSCWLVFPLSSSALYPTKN